MTRLSPRLFGLIEGCCWRLALRDGILPEMTLSVSANVLDVLGNYKFVNMANETFNIVANLEQSIIRHHGCYNEYEAQQ